MSTHNEAFKLIPDCYREQAIVTVVGPHRLIFPCCMLCQCQKRPRRFAAKYQCKTDLSLIVGVSSSSTLA